MAAHRTKPGEQPDPPRPAHVTMTGALDPRDAWSADTCMLAATLDVISTRSAFLLLREAFYGATRFEEFVRRTGLSEPAAASRLRELVAHGLLEREDYREPGQRARPGYLLSTKGIDMLPALVALMQWGDKWASASGGRNELRHTGCDEPVHAELRCGAGHPVSLDELELAPKER